MKRKNVSKKKMNVKKYLEKIGVTFRVFKHPAVYTTEQAEEYSKDIKGIPLKNLFVKDRKSKNFYLIIMPAEENMDFGKFGEIVGKKIKFANEQDLKKYLDITPGAVGPFGLINNKDHEVNVLIKKVVADEDYVSFHSNINTETLELTQKDFQKYLKSLKNDVQII